MVSIIFRFTFKFYNLNNGADTSFRLKITSTSGSPVNMLMSLSLRQPTRPNTVPTSDLSPILRRKHVRQISSLVFSDICSRMPGASILNWHYHGQSTEYYFVENMPKFPEKEPLKPQMLHMLILKPLNGNGLIWCFQTKSNFHVMVTSIFIITTIVIFTALC